MASKINTSPQKDDNGMHTPIRHAGSLDGSNVMDSLRRRIASTALRPKPTGLNRYGPSQHDTINLDDSDVLELDSAKTAVATTQSAPVTFKMPELPRPPRASSLWLQDVITSAQSVAEKIRLQSEQVESPQVWQSIDSDCSSLGILTPSAMLDTFGGTGNEISDSYRSLMKNKETNQGNLDKLVSAVNDSSISDKAETTQESQDYVSAESQNYVSAESKENSFSFSELDKVAPDFNMGISPQPDFGFDSKEFISADSSAVMKKMEDGEISVINAAKNDPIPSFQRIDIGDFSGFIGDGEIDVSCRPSWISPEKRKLAAPRITIGEYFSLKSYDVKDLDKCLYPPQTNAYNIYPADSVRALEPKKMTTNTLSDTIDLTNDDADKTITLEDTLGSEKKKGNDTLDDILDMTLIPGRDSIVSLSMISNLLNSTKGSDTVVGQLFDAAKSKSTRKTSTTVNSSSMENIPPSHSRETFVISSSQHTPDQSTFLVKSKPRTPLKNDNKINALSSPSRIPILSYQKDMAPSPLKRNVPRKHTHTSPYFRQNSTSAVKSPVLNKTGQSSPKIKLPICVQGSSRGVVGLPMKLKISVENTSDAPICVCLVSTSRSKHLEVSVGDTMTIEPKKSDFLKFEATALISGEHTIHLEVRVNFGLGGEEYTVLPFKLDIEAPKIIIAKQYKGMIDFGLRPEESRKVEIFTVQNLGFCSVPLKIAIEQDVENPSFFLLVPSDDEDENGISLVSSMGFLLPGHETDTESTLQDIGIVFIPPPLSNLSAANEDCVKFEAQMTITLNLPADKSDGRVLDRCIIRGEVGRTMLLVSQTDLVLVPGKPTILKVYNGGVVPLDLTFQATTMPDDAGNVTCDPTISIEPTNSLLIPNQSDSLTLIYKPKPNCVTTLNRELHLSYDGLSTGNIVSLICHPNQDLPQLVERGQSPKIPLPLKTTRHQLSWGSISSGQMSQQQLSFKNSGKQNLSLNICIENSEGGDDSPFKLLSEASEVTKNMTMQLRPDQDARVTVMFCPLRPGPAVARMQISSSDSRYAVNKLLLNGYGGHSQVLLRKVSVAHGHSWLILKPSFDDCVVGSFNIVNNGTLPACVLITSTSNSDLSCCPTLKPNNLIVSARGCQAISVRIPDVQNILSKTSSGEVVSLCTLKIVWINEVSRNRLRRLLPKLNTTERVMLLRLENMKTMQNLIYAPTETQEFANKKLDVLNDYTFYTASSLCKDVSTLTLELRAEGTGQTCEIGNIDGDTVSPFVSFMDNTILVTPDSQAAHSEAQNSMHASVSSASVFGLQWELAPKELFLMPANGFQAKFQIHNRCTTNRLCYDVIVRDELFVSPNIGSVLPNETAVFELQLQKTPSHHYNWPDAVKVYDANGVKTISVRVVPLAIGKSVLMQQNLRSSCSSTSSSTSSSSSSVSTSQWFTPGKSMQSPFPFTHSSRSNAPTPNSDQIKRKQASTGLNTTGNDVYLDTNTISFPWTKINTASNVKITLYNKSSSSDKEVRVSRVPPPFSVDPTCFVVPKEWHTSITATFRPDILNIFSERIEFTVKDQEIPVVVCFEGNSVASKQF